ncbi:RNA pyrophosphohydrolase [uncultured archaeon]|nr:RNA pyrophosphohydrolase [uncultured archaeon]
MIREVVCGLIIEDKKLLVARKEVGGKSSWILPGGKIERGEHPYEGLVRELKEELPYMKWDGLWVPWQYFTGISPNNKSPIRVLAFYLDGKTNGDYRPSERADEPIKETRLVDCLDLLKLGLSDVSREMVYKLQQERRI